MYMSDKKNMARHLNTLSNSVIIMIIGTEMGESWNVEALKFEAPP